MTDKLAKTESSAHSALANQEAQRTVMAGVGNHIMLVPGIDESFRFRLPRLGKIRLGVRVESQNNRPKEVDYFILPDELRTNKKFRAVLENLGQDPDKPKALPIQLPSNLIAVNVRRTWDVYNLAHVLLSRWDGLTCTKLNKQTGQYEETQCVCPRECEDCFVNDKTVIHRLNVMLPDAPDIGVWQIDFGALNSYTNLTTEMALKLGALKKLGGIDFVLTREQRDFQQNVVKNGEIKTTTTPHWLLHLRSDLTRRELEELAKEATAFDAAEIADFDYTPDDLEFDSDSEEVEDAEEVEEVDNPGEPEPVSAQATEEEPATRELRARVAGELFRDFPVQKARQAFLVSIQGLGNNPPDLSKMSQDQLVLVRERLTKRKEANRTPNTQGTLDEPMPTE